MDINYSSNFIEINSNLNFSVPVTADLIKYVIKEAAANLLYLRHQIPQTISELQTIFEVFFLFYGLK